VLFACAGASRASLAGGRAPFPRRAVMPVQSMLRLFLAALHSQSFQFAPCGCHPCRFNRKARSKNVRFFSLSCPSSPGCGFCPLCPRPWWRRRRGLSLGPGAGAVVRGAAQPVCVRLVCGRGRPLGRPGSGWACACVCLSTSAFLAQAGPVG